MAVIDETIRLEDNSSISFGNYQRQDKAKVDGFEVGGDLYKVKTHNLVTRLEKNGALLMETVPGAAIHGLKLTDAQITFAACGLGNTQVTMELEPENEYGIVIDNTTVGNTKTNISGKLSFSIELSHSPQNVRITKV